MNVLALSRDEFNATVRELEAQGMDTAGLKRQYREASSPFSPLYEAANRNRAELAEEGRRPVLGGLFSKEPVAGVDTIRYEGFGPMMAGLLEPVARAVDAPYSAAQGLIPAEDMIGEAMGTAGVAMGAGGAVARPAGSVGMGGRRVFHGGKDFISDPQATVDPEGLLTGFSVTPSKSVAEMYSRLRDGDAVSEFLVDEDRLNAIDEMALYDLQDRLERERGLDEGDLSQDDLLAELGSRGINAVDYADPEFGLRVLDPSILKPVNGDQSVVSANASKSAGLLGSAAGSKASNDFGQGWSDAYHWTRSPDPFDQFDPDRSTSAMSQLGPHVGTKAAAEARIKAFPNDAATGQMLELRADTRRPFLNPRTNEPWSETGLEVFISQFADEHGVDRRQAAPLMRRMLSEEGYTDIPYVNDIEDAGSVSNIMLVDRPSGSDAVLRRSDAAFDPSRRASPNLTAANAPTPAGLLAMQADDEQDIRAYLRSRGLLNGL